MLRLAVRVAREHCEPVLAELLELVPAGLEERDVDAQTVEYVLYGAAGELPALGHVRAAAGGALVDVHTDELPDDWAERWRSFHAAFDVGRLRIRPPWEPPRADALDVVIDPGQAFGTGSHPTTRLTLELLTTLPAGGPLADWGCGSGVLAVAAARLGFEPVRGCDHDPAALRATAEAAAANGVRIETSRCDLRRGAGPWAPVVLANLVRPLLLELAPRLGRPPAHLIVSGLTDDEADAVAEAFPLREAARRSAGGWTAIHLRA